MSKKKVGIIFGGMSVEHEVSLLSAKSVINNTNTELYDISAIFIDKNGSWHRANIDNWLKDGDIEVNKKSLLTPSLNYKNPVFFEIQDSKVIDELKLDVVFPVLHGTFGEDGTVQGLFELMGIPFVGASVLGSAIGMDKLIMKAVLNEASLPVVPYFGFYRYEWETSKEEITAKVNKEIGYPCFVKSADLGSSVGISKVNSEKFIDEAVKDSCKYSNRILIEKAVSNPREIEISVLGHENPIASLPGEIIPHRDFYDYRAKYLEEGTGLVAPADIEDSISNKLRDLAIKTFKALDCSGMARVDFLINAETEEFFIGEINTIPGFTQISMYPKLWEITYISFSDLIAKLLDLAIERKNESMKLETDITEKI